MPSRLPPTRKQRRYCSGRARTSYAKAVALAPKARGARGPSATRAFEQVNRGRRAREPAVDVETCPLDESWGHGKGDHVAIICDPPPTLADAGYSRLDLETLLCVVFEAAVERVRRGTESLCSMDGVPPGAVPGEVIVGRRDTQDERQSYPHRDGDPNPAGWPGPAACDQRQREGQHEQEVAVAVIGKREWKQISAEQRQQIQALASIVGCAAGDRLHRSHGRRNEHDHSIRGGDCGATPEQAGAAVERSRRVRPGIVQKMRAA